MLRPVLLTSFLVAAAMLFPSGGSAPGHPSAASAQGVPWLGIDSCTEVKPGDQFTMDISARGLPSILAWEMYFTYDRRILEVVDKDVRLLLADAPNSNVFDFSDPVPSVKGVYRIAAADLGGKSSAETGSGVLARLTLRARAEGVSAASISALDVNDDQIPDLGPSLTGVDGKHISDIDGDAIFDGPTLGGQVAVGIRCSPDPPDPPVEDIEDAVIIRPEANPATVAGGDGPAPAASSSPTGASSGSPQPTRSLGNQPGAASATPVRSVISERSGASDEVPAWLYAFFAGVGLIVGMSILIIIRSARRSR